MMRSDPPDTDQSRALALGKALRRLREMRGLSQQDAADLIPTTQQTWHRYETAGNLQFLKHRNQREYAEALGFTVEHLLEEADAVAAGTAAPIPPPDRARSRAAALPQPRLAAVQTLPNFSYTRWGDAGMGVFEGERPEPYDITGLIDPNMRVLKVTAEDMVPFVEPGGIVTYNTKAPPRRNQGVVLKTREGRLLIRRYLRTTTSSVEVFCFEPFSHDGALCYRERSESFALADIIGVYPIGLRAD